jgi:cell division protease FtsH
VAGVDEAKTELQEVVEFLKYPEKFNSLGARIPRGVLLVGPPGTGKTLMARAVAGEAGVPFFSISGSEFVEMFVGVGASRVRDLFDQAKRNSPCIVFVDEIDAVGRQRGAGLGGSHDEREQTLNQILVEMDGFDTNTNVIVVAATNRPDVLDPALLRPGRFDRQVILDRPDMRGRTEILKVHTKGKPLDKGVEVEGVARQSPGFSGADLANLVNEAAILAARRNKKVIGMSEFQEALERIVAGPERKSRIISDAEKAIIAYHEGGHAVVQRILPKCDPVAKVTIISRGMALGYTMALPQEDRYLQSKTEFEDKIAGLLGGNVAERLIFGDTTTGASNDIEKATDLARRMVTEFGMSDKLGPLSFGKRDEMIFLGRSMGEQRDYSDEVARTIDEEVRAIIDKAYDRATEVLTTHRDKLITLAEKLVAEETVDAEGFEALFSDLPAKENIHGMPTIVGPGQPIPEPNPQPA